MAMLLDRADAAVARRQATRAVADRPRERRNGAAPSAPARMLARAQMVIRAADTSDTDALNFEGYASVTSKGYDMFDAFGPYTEVVSAGAFDQSLSREDLDVPLVLGHDSMRRIARTTNGTLQLSADDIGLLTRAPGLDPADADVAYIAPKIRSGLIDEMSFRFRITAGEWSDDWTEYHIEGADIHRGDVSIVGYGANPATSAQLRSLEQRVLAGDDLTETETEELRSGNPALMELVARTGSARRLSRAQLEILALSVS